MSVRIGPVEIRRQTCCRGTVGTLGCVLIVLGALGIAWSQNNRLRLGLSSGAALFGAIGLSASICCSKRPPRSQLALEAEERAYQARVAAVGERDAVRDLGAAAHRMLGHYMRPAHEETPENRLPNQVAARRAVLQDMAAQPARHQTVGFRTLELMVGLLADPAEELRTHEARDLEERDAVRREIQVMTNVITHTAWQVDAALSQLVRWRACMACLSGVARTGLQGGDYGQLLANWSGVQEAKYYQGAVMAARTGLRGLEQVQRMNPLLRAWAANLPDQSPAQTAVLALITEEPRVV
jgi:hypothetical protein